MDDAVSQVMPRPGCLCPAKLGMWLPCKKIRYRQILFYFVPHYLLYIICLSATYQSDPHPKHPTCIASKDHYTDHQCWRGVQGELIGKPKGIIIITKEKMLGPLQELVNVVDPSHIHILTVPFKYLLPTNHYSITIYSIELKILTWAK